MHRNISKKYKSKKNITLKNKVGGAIYSPGGLLVARLNIVEIHKKKYYTGKLTPELAADGLNQRVDGLNMDLKKYNECSKIPNNTALVKYLEKLKINEKKMNLVLFPHCHGNSSKFILEPFKDSGVTFLNDTSMRTGVSNPTHFKNYLNGYIKNPSFEEEKKGLFLVSQSEFMTSLVELLLKESRETALYTDIRGGIPVITFNNLDILHIQYDRNTETYSSMTIRRYDKNYNINDIAENHVADLPFDKSLLLNRAERNIRETFETVKLLPITLPVTASSSNSDQSAEKIKQIKKTQNPIINIFIMAGCLDCKKKFNTKNYSDSICLQDTMGKLDNKIFYLQKLLKKYCFFDEPGREDIHKYLNQIDFGSSIKFITVLTSIILFDSLSKSKNNLITQYESNYPTMNPEPKMGSTSKSNGKGVLYEDNYPKTNSFANTGGKRYKKKTKKKR